MPAAFFTSTVMYVEAISVPPSAPFSASIVTVGAVEIFGNVNDMPDAGSTPRDTASTAGRPEIVLVANSVRCGARVKPVFVLVSFAAFTYWRESSSPSDALIVCSRYEPAETIGERGDV